MVGVEGSSSKAWIDGGGAVGLAVSGRLGSKEPSDSTAGSTDGREIDAVGVAEDKGSGLAPEGRKVDVDSVSGKWVRICTVN